MPALRFQYRVLQAQEQRFQGHLRERLPERGLLGGAIGRIGNLREVLIAGPRNSEIEIRVVDHLILARSVAMPSEWCRPAVEAIVFLLVTYAHLNKPMGLGHARRVAVRSSPPRLPYAAPRSAAD